MWKSWYGRHWKGSPSLTHHIEWHSTMVPSIPRSLTWAGNRWNSHMDEDQSWWERVDMEYTEMDHLSWLITQSCLQRLRNLTYLSTDSLGIFSLKGQDVGFALTNGVETNHLPVKQGPITSRPNAWINIPQICFICTPKIMSAWSLCYRLARHTRIFF